MTSVALIAAIEGNDRNLNSVTNTSNIVRLFEDEAVLCFSNWRKNGGYLKDIPIHVMCPTTNVITNLTRQRLHNLEVTYDEEYHPETERFTSGFLNIPYVGMVYEKRLDVDVLIKIDLDMNLIQPLPQTWVESGQTIIGQYDDYCTKQQRGPTSSGHNPLDTGFIISPTKSKFYTAMYERVGEILSGKTDDQWESIKAVTGEYYLEEYVADTMYDSHQYDITPVQRYQVGEGYTPIKEFSDDELQRVYFWHEHIIHEPGYDRVRQHVEYFNRIAKMRKEMV